MWNISTNLAAHAAMQQAQAQTSQQNQTIGAQVRSDSTKGQGQRHQILQNSQTRLHEMQSETRFDANAASSQIHNRVLQWMRS